MRLFTEAIVELAVGNVTVLAKRTAGLGWGTGVEVKTT